MVFDCKRNSIKLSTEKYDFTWFFAIILYSMAKYYPRSQTFITFIVSGFFVIGTYIAINGLPSSSKQVSFKNESVKPIINVKEDTSFKEEPWQKEFFDQKQQKVDTKKATDISKSNQNQKLTATEVFSRNFFTKYAELRQSGLNNNASAVESVTNQLINESLDKMDGAKVYDLKDIKINPNANDAQSIKNYAETLMSILSKWMPDKNEAEIVTSALETDNMELLKDIDPIISGYQKTLNSLKSLTVPETLALPHLNLINGVSMQIYNAKVIRNIEKDPLPALNGIRHELDSIQKVSSAVDDMKTIFDQYGLVFITNKK